MDWDFFRVVLAVHREGSLSAAARVLDVNQATVGRQLKRGETQLNAKLFHRLNNGLFLTEAGKTAIKYAFEMEARVLEANSKLLASNDNIAGVIRLSIPHNLLQFDLSKDIRDFQARYPDIVLEIEASDTPQKFQDRDVDIVIRADNCPPSGLWGYKLAEMTFEFYASQAYMNKWGNQIEENPASARLPFIALAIADPAADFALFKATFQNAHEVVRCSSFASVLPMVRDGAGAARIARFMAPKSGDLVSILPCGDTHNRLLWILTHPDYRDTKRVRLFMDFIHERFLSRAALPC